MTEPSPLFEHLTRGEAERDARLLAAQGGLELRASEQVAVLVFLLDDPDREIRQTADNTLNRIPVEALSKFLARPGTPLDLLEFFADRGVFPDETSGEAAGEGGGEGGGEGAGEGADDAPIVAAQPVDAVEAAAALGIEDVLLDKDQMSITQKIQKMNFTQRLIAASKGTREMRSILVRDNNKMIAAAVMSSPKLTESEIEAFSRMASVSEDVLRMIAHNRSWMKSYRVVLGLVKNPKFPVALSLNLLQRVNAKDVAQIAIDRNIPEPLRVAARKKTFQHRT